MVNSSAALGTFTAFWAVRALVAFGPEQVPRLRDVAIDPAVLAFIDPFGAVKINDSIWRATSADAIEAGATVEVLSVDGVTLTVAKA